MLEKTIEYLMYFAYYYPLFMAYVWMAGGLYYRFHWERGGSKDYQHPIELEHYPPVSILLPCYNEGDNARETIAYLLNQDYPEFELIAVNDGSKDNTGAVLDELQLQHDNLRVIHLAKNQGKARGLNVAALMAKHDIFICIDGDAVLDKHATKWLVKHFIDSPRVGAVTGNPRIRNRSTLLGKLQVGEFSSIIGMIKRAQRIYGRVFTVSGVVVAFRRAALHRVGYWSTDMITEDIDVSWRLQMDHWDIRYEPNALCWILMPETIKGVWKQRLRWAQGGAEVFFKYVGQLFTWRRRRMWMVAVEYLLSVIWSYTVFAVLVCWLLGKFIDMPAYLAVPSIIPGWNGVLLGVTCLLQFAVSMMIDSRYEEKLARYYYWMVWYPLAYWMINMFTSVVGFLKAIFRKRGSLATWESPDRGVHNEK